MKFERIIKIYLLTNILFWGFRDIYCYGNIRKIRGVLFIRK